MDLPYSEHLATTTKINNKALYFDVGNKSIVIHNNNNNNENDNGYDPNEITAQMTDSIHVNHNVDNNVDHDVENTKNTDTVRVVATMRDVLRQLALANSTTVAPTQRAFLEVMGVLEQSYNGIDISSLIASKFLKINELEREKTIANTKSVFSRDFDARSAPPPNTRRQSKSNVGTDDIVKEQELKCRSESPSCKRMRVESTTIETTTSIEEEEVELQEDLSGDEDSNGARKQKIAGIAQENDNNEDVQEGTRKDEGSTLAAMLMQAAVASGALGGSVSTDGSTGSVDSANFQFLAAAAAAAAQNFAPASNFSPAAALQFLSRMAPLATSTTVTNSTSSVPLQAPSITISEAAGTAEGSSSAATSGSCASLQASYDALCSPAKRARTRITDDQLKILRQYFDINNSPSEEQIKEMSHKAQLPEKVIKHWFRNTLFKERQRDKDSPYNFNIPPQMSIDLATYEKTGEAKITSIKPELDGESSANSPSSSNAESKPKAQRGVSEVSEDPSESSGIDEPVVIIDEDRDQEPPTCQDYDNERRISSSGSEFSYKKEEFKESESSLSSESAHQQAQSSGLNGNMDLNSLLNGIVNVDTNLLSTLFVNAGFTMPFLSTASTSAVTPSLSQPASTVVNGASESAARHSPTVSIGTLSCGSASGLTVGSGRRANRTRFTDFQLRTLQNFFDRQAYPKDDDLEMLSKKLGLSPRVIVVWFQNARQKARKINENQPLAANVSGAPSFERVGVAPYFQCKRCVLQFSRFFDLVQHQQKVCYVNDPEALNIDNNSIDEGISDEERILADGMNPLLNGFLAAAAAGASAENFSPELLGALGAAAFGACNFKTSAKQNDENSENLFESMGLLDGSKAGTSGQIFSESDVERYAISEFGRPTATSPLDLSLANCAEKFNVFPSRDMRASTVSESGDDAQNLSRAVSTSPYAICTPSSALSAAAQMGTFLAQFAQQQHHHNQPQNSVGHFGAAGDNAAACAAAAAAAAAANNSKRYRTHLTPQQVFVMKSLFNDYKTPSMGECETLGREIGLHKRVVQVWFQNARAKERKCRSGGLMGSENASDDAPAKNGIAATRCELCALEFSAAGLSVQEHIFTHAHIERVRATMRTVGGGASEGAISESGTGTLDDASRANITQVVGAANSDLDASTVITSQFPYNLMCGLQSAGALSLMYDANLLGTPVARLQIPERVMQSIHEDLTRGAIATNFTQDGLNFEQLAEKISPRDFECSTSIETEVGWACTQCRNVFQHEDYLRAHQKHICKNCNDTFRLVQSYYECIVCKCKTGTQEEFRIHCDTLAHKSAVALFSRDSTPNRTNGTTAEATTTSA